MADRSEHLRGADIGTAQHADLAVRMRQCGGPLHRVVAIIDLVLEGVPLAVGGVAAAHILHHHHEAARNCLGRKFSGSVLVVGGPLQKHRERTLADWAIDVGLERDAVARLHRDVVLEEDLRRGRLREPLRCGEFKKDGSADCECEKAERFSGHGFPRDESRSPF